MNVTMEIKPRPSSDKVERRIDVYAKDRELEQQRVDFQKFVKARFTYGAPLIWRAVLDCQKPVIVVYDFTSKAPKNLEKAYRIIFPDSSGKMTSIWFRVCNPGKDGWTVGYEISLTAKDNDWVSVRRRLDRDPDGACYIERPVYETLIEACDRHLPIKQFLSFVFQESSGVTIIRGDLVSTLRGELAGVKRRQSTER